MYAKSMEGYGRPRLWKAMYVKAMEDYVCQGYGRLCMPRLRKATHAKAMEGYGMTRLWKAIEGYVCQCYGRLHMPRLQKATYAKAIEGYVCKGYGRLCWYINQYMHLTVEGITAIMI